MEVITMKKITSLIVALIIVSLSQLSVLAADPAHPSKIVNRYFRELYAKTDDVDNLSLIYNTKYYITSDDYLESEFVCFALVDFSSNNVTQEPYFNRFGDNNEYYEYCEVTNLLFESGLAVFAGLVYNTTVNHDEDFYSIKEMYSTKPEIIDMIIERQLTDRVGYIGDADGDGEVAILDATVIQRHLAQLDTLDREYREYACDIDDDGTVDVLDATIIQRKLAALE